MNIVKIIRTHLSYLFTKKNIILIILINTIILFYLLFSSSIFDGIKELDSSRDYYYNLYKESSFSFISMIYITFILFINMSYFSGSYSKYSQYFIKSDETRRLFFITKYISIILLISVELLLISLFYYSILIFLPYYKAQYLSFKYFYNIYLIGLFYLLISSFLLKITKSYLSSLGLIITYFISIIIGESSELNLGSKIYLSIFPSLNNISFTYIHGNIGLILILVISILLNIIITITSDSL